MLVGDPSIFAIESTITQPLRRPSELAIGYFVLYVAGNMYGVRSPNATLMACSYDCVTRRISRRGKHVLVFDKYTSSEIAEAVHGALYDERRQNEIFLGMSADDLREVLQLNEIVWAPDGDAAFDDGGHVLQFDCGDMVRIIGFVNSSNSKALAKTLSEIWLESDKFYNILGEWKAGFEYERNLALKGVHN